jgi:hypothetical protein
MTGVRVIFASPVARTAVLLLWLAGLYGVTEGGVIVPLAHQLGGGAATAGWLLATVTGAAAVGLAVYVRVAGKQRASRWAAVVALAACGLLALFFLPVTLAGTVIILAASSLCAGYQPIPQGALMNAVPGEHQAQASGVYGAGMYAGQGIMFIIAGAVAQQISPTLVIAVTGTIGAVLAVPLAVTWRRVRPQ